VVRLQGCCHGPPALPLFAAAAAVAVSLCLRTVARMLGVAECNRLKRRCGALTGAARLCVLCALRYMLNGGVLVVFLYHVPITSVPVLCGLSYACLHGVVSVVGRMGSGVSGCEPWCSLPNRMCQSILVPERIHTRLAPSRPKTWLKAALYTVLLGLCTALGVLEAERFYLS